MLIRDPLSARNGAASSLTAAGESPSGSPEMLSPLFRPPRLDFSPHFQRIELHLAAHDNAMRADAHMSLPFRLDADRTLVLGPQAQDVPTWLRFALEWQWLSREAGLNEALAGVAAARVAALFARLDKVCGYISPLPDWVGMLAGPRIPAFGLLAAFWQRIRAHDATATAPLAPEVYRRLEQAWTLLGPSEWLMENGGDARLRVDSASGLNGYGCSHRPRAWAVTFASSTASSVSERGYMGAEIARRRVMAAVLRGDVSLAGEAARVRAEIAHHYGLASPDQVVLAASGTDCELIATGVISALRAQSGATQADAPPLTNILMASEETGTGVPMAARLQHFAMETARGVAVQRGVALAGDVGSIVLANVAARDPAGQARDPESIAQECASLVDHAPGPVLLHVLDCSKTGLIAPGEARALALQARRPTQVDVVVDACQARQDPSRVRQYLDHEWMVLVTGSKFFTGPPFAGALLVPPAMLARLANVQALPAGLADYTARTEWPDVAAARGLPEQANAGMLLRWSAALAEMQAFTSVPPQTRRAILGQFTERVREAIHARPFLSLLDDIPIDAATSPAGVGETSSKDGPWDEIRTIIGFGVHRGSDRVLLDLEDARRVYRWLNADLASHLQGLDAEAERVATRLCHIGQPVLLPDGQGGQCGVLRLSAGARLVSGEQCYAALPEAERVRREIMDAVLVLDKIGLILRHWRALLASDPQPHYLCAPAPGGVEVLT